MSSIVALTSSYDAHNPRFLASDAGVWMVPWLLSAEDRLPRRLTVIKTRSECSETGSDKLQTTQLGFYERFCDCTSTWNIQALLAQFQKPWF
jgi:hypothetical protein